MIRYFILSAFVVFSGVAFGQITAQFSTNKVATDYCVGDTVSFTNTSQGDYRVCWWEFGDGTETWAKNPKHIYKNVGDYVVTLVITDDSENKSKATVTLKVNAIPKVSVTNNIMTQTLTAKSSDDAVKYRWIYEKDTTSTTEPEFFYLEEGNYTVVVTNLSGCSAVATIFVNLETANSTTDSLQIIVKNNILTPDLRDGVNDVLFIEGLSTYKANCRILIYNEWGQIVYRNSNYKNIDGFAGIGDKKQQLDAGTYYYIIKTEGRKPATGYIDIIR